MPKNEYHCPYCGGKVVSRKVPVQSIDDGIHPPDDIVAHCEKCDRDIIFPDEEDSKHA